MVWTQNSGLVQDYPNSTIYFHFMDTTNGKSTKNFGVKMSQTYFKSASLSPDDKYLYAASEAKDRGYLIVVDASNGEVIV